MVLKGIYLLLLGQLTLQSNDPTHASGDPNDFVSIYVIIELRAPQIGGHNCANFFLYAESISILPYILL